MEDASQTCEPLILDTLNERAYLCVNAVKVKLPCADYPDATVESKEEPRIIPDETFF